MTELQKYIEASGSYKTGVSILEGLNPLSVALKELKPYVDKRFAPTTAQTLLRATLLAYYQQPAPSARVTPKTEEPRKDIPPVIVKLQEEQRFLRDQRRALHFTLEDTPEPSDRAAKAQQIRSLTKRIDAIFNQLDAWELNGTVPNVATVGDARAGGLEVLELTKKEKYYRERLSRLKVWMESPDIPLSRKERYKTEYALKKSELSVIEQTLKTLHEGR